MKALLIILTLFILSVPFWYIQWQHIVGRRRLVKPDLWQGLTWGMNIGMWVTVIYLVFL